MTASELKTYIATQLQAPLNQVSKLIASLNATVDFTDNSFVSNDAYVLDEQFLFDPSLNYDQFQNGTGTVNLEDNDSSFLKAWIIDASFSNIGFGKDYAGLKLKTNLGIGKGKKIILEGSFNISNKNTSLGGEKEIFFGLVETVDPSSLTDIRRIGIYSRAFDGFGTGGQYFASTCDLIGLGIEENNLNTQVVIDQFVKMKIEISADGNTVDFYINNVLKGTTTTHSPINYNLIPIFYIDAPSVSRAITAAIDRIKLTII